MDARERILGALKHSEPVPAADGHSDPAPTQEPEAVLRVPAEAKQLRQSPPKAPPPLEQAFDRGAPPLETLRAKNRSARGRIAVFAACVIIVASAGTASLLLRPARPATATSEHNTAAVAPASSEALPKPAPESIVFGEDKPYEVTVRGQSDAPQDMPTAAVSESPAIPERAFVPPPEQPRADTARVMLPEPALSVQTSGTAVAEALPAPANRPEVPVFKPKPSPTVVVGGKVDPPQLIQRFAPVFPEAARVSKTEGLVRLEATIGKDGRVRNVRRLSGSVILAGACENAIRRWIYKPAMVDGRPVEAETRIEINFRMNE
ncbi:MAG TPA: TonB family protein [Bryobacteraceae bacterium]|nr:TonB family protein [Bryobacteraceae bacterium]